MDKESSRGMRLLAPSLNNRNLIFFGSPVPALALAKVAVGKEHCSETLLPLASVALNPPAWQAGLWPAPEKWLLAGAGLLPLLQVVCLWFMCFCVLRCFSGSHTVLPKEHGLGVIFLSSFSSCYAVFFFNSSCISLLIILVWLCMWRIIKNLEPWTNLESVIVKYSKYPHRCSDWQKHIYLKTSDSSAPEPCRSTTHTIKIILQAAAIPGFQTEMATERQNLRTAALNEQQINKAVFVFSWKKLD